MATSKKETSALQSNVIMVLGVGIVLGFVLGHLWTKVNLLEGGTARNADTAGQEAAVPDEPTNVEIAQPDPDDDNWLGPVDARYVHVEYSDFECPYCQAYIPTLEQIKADYGDQMAFVYRHFPLSFHPLAQPSAEASECVADLGGNDAFWKFHDDIFAAMPDVTVEGLVDFATGAGVDAAAFQDCYDAGTFTERVNAQLAEGSSAGINATPTSVIYDMETGESVVIEGAQPYDRAKAIIDGFIE